MRHQLYHTKHTLLDGRFNAVLVYLFKQPSGLTYYQWVLYFSGYPLIFKHMAGYHPLIIIFNSCIIQVFSSLMTFISRPVYINQ